MRRASFLTVVLTLTLAIATATPASASSVVQVNADVRYQGPKVPKSFLGFSQELNLIPFEVGFPLGGVNEVTVGFYRALAKYGGGAPYLRIGGGSQDDAWWNPGGVRPRPMGIRLDIDEGFFAGVERLMDATDSKALIGLNLAIDDPQEAVAMARGARSQIRPKHLLGFEVGNEPYVFVERPIGADANGKTIFTRPKTYDARQYLAEFEPYVRALRRLDPFISMTAGAFTPETSSTFLRRVGSRLDEFAIHNYGVSGCKEKGKKLPTPEILLQEDIMTRGRDAVYKVTREPLKYGIVPRVTETNTATCGGIYGVGDRHAAALWGVDWMFNLAAIGMRGVHFHNSSPAYRPFVATQDEKGSIGFAAPLLYGMLMFAEATPHGARLLPSTYLRSDPIGKNARANIKAWGSVDAKDKVVRVALLNKGSRKPVTIDVTVPYARGGGRLKRLTAPSIRATGEQVRWGGQAFSSPTRTGKLEGTERRQRVRRRKGSRYRVVVPNGTAALLTVPVTRTRANVFVRP